jgi:hypothetical protein
MDQALVRFRQAAARQKRRPDRRREGRHPQLFQDGSAGASGKRRHTGFEPDIGLSDLAEQRSDEHINFQTGLAREIGERCPFSTNSLEAGVSRRAPRWCVAPAIYFAGARRAPQGFARSARRVHALDPPGALPCDLAVAGATRTGSLSPNRGAVRSTESGGCWQRDRRSLDAASRANPPRARPEPEDGYRSTALAAPTQNHGPIETAYWDLSDQKQIDRASLPGLDHSDIRFRDDAAEDDPRSSPEIEARTRR